MKKKRELTSFNHFKNKVYLYVYSLVYSTYLYKTFKLLPC